MSLPVLCINLAGATRRWESIQHQVLRSLPDASLQRIEAVAWPDLPPDLPGVSLFTRYLIQVPDAQRTHRCSHRQLDTVSSVAILLSHIRCWEWLIAGKAPYALILEDDACFDAGFPDVWATQVQPLLRDPSAWDCLVLGYFSPAGPETPAPLLGVPLIRVVQFFGAHAYILTRQGAQVFMRHAFPVDHHSDGMMLTLHELGLLRLYLLPHSVISQCLDGVDRLGSWHTHTTMTMTSVTTLINSMPTWTDSMPAWTVLVVVIAFVALLGYLLRRA